MAERIKEVASFTGIYWLGSYGFRKATEGLSDAVHLGMHSVPHEETIPHQLGECNCGRKNV